MPGFFLYNLNQWLDLPLQCHLAEYDHALQRRSILYRFCCSTSALLQHQSSSSSTFFAPILSANHRASCHASWLSVAWAI